MADKIYNVKVSVVALVEARSERDAINRLELLLMQAGFDPYEGDSHAFVSEDLPAGTEVL